MAKKIRRVIECCPRCENVRYNAPEELFWCNCDPLQKTYKMWKKYIANLNKPYYDKSIHKDKNGT